MAQKLNVLVDKDISAGTHPDIYSANSISMLDERTSVRKKAGMYCGNLGKSGLQHLTFEVLSNSVDEVINAKGDTIIFILHKDDYVEVIDNGRGIPTGHNTVYDQNALDMIMLYKHSGGKLDASTTTYQSGSIGTNGLGLFITNCLSSDLIVTSKRDGKIRMATYGEGLLKTPVVDIGDAPKGVSGTSIKWKADFSIFSEDAVYDPAIIMAKLRTLSYMAPGVKFIYKDVRDDKNIISEEYISSDGIQDLVKDSLIGKPTIFKNNIFINGSQTHTIFKTVDDVKVPFERDIKVEVCFNWDLGNRSERMMTFVNGNDIPMGGTMVNGFQFGLTKAINKFSRDGRLLKEKDADFKFSEIKDGLTYCIHITHPDPSFDGQTKVKFNNTEVSPIVNTLVFDKMERYTVDNHRDCEKLVDYLLRLRKGRIDADKAMDNATKKILSASVSSIDLAEFVVDTTGDDRSINELFIVEGKSALSSCKTGRDARFQAVFPLRGKMINTYTKTLAASVANKEIQALLKVVGTGATHSNTFDIRKSRYARYIIMSDADNDGQHITNLVLTAFYKFLLPLIEAGMVYISKMPLFSITSKDGEEFFFTNEEYMKAATEKEANNIKFHTTRYKGLGEMNPEEIAMHGFNPATRRLTRIVVPDKITGDDTSGKNMTNIHSIVDSVMGEDVPIKRSIILDSIIR